MRAATALMRIAAALIMYALPFVRTATPTATEIRHQRRVSIHRLIVTIQTPVFIPALWKFAETA